MQVTLGQAKMDMSSVGDTWDACWADDDEIYVSSDDSLGFENQPGSNLQFHLLTGQSVQGLRGRTINGMQEYGPMTSSGPDGCMWKASGLTCINGTLYLFVSRHGLDFEVRQTAQNSSLILSTDKGLTWHRSAEENYQKPMFPGSRFGSPFFIKYGKDGAGDVHNAESFVYAVSNNGFWENGDDMILGRSLKTKLAHLDASDWQFFTGGDGMESSAWSPDLRDASPIISNLGKCSMTGVQYFKLLNSYLMIQWYYTNGTGHMVSDNTTWLFYKAATPWGPWEQFGMENFTPEAYYNPCILPKFISEDGLSFTVITNANFQTFPEHEKGTSCLYRLTYIPCTLRA